jgi:hypothetical protein
MPVYVIRAVEFANGAFCPHSGQWLSFFNHEAFNGQGWGSFTSDLQKAKRFRNREEALSFWKRQSEIRPLRPDGAPNRPLTALTIEIEPLP